jgi:hypothetical protein
MISWGLGNPVKEVLFHDGAHRLRALEACHLAQGAGMTIELAMALRAVFAKWFWRTHRMDSASIPLLPVGASVRIPEGGVQDHTVSGLLTLPFTARPRSPGAFGA